MEDGERSGVELTAFLVVISIEDVERTPMAVLVPASSSLSPSAPPFLPRCALVGHSKFYHWVKDSLGYSNEDCSVEESSPRAPSRKVRQGLLASLTSSAASLIFHHHRPYGHHHTLS